MLALGILAVAGLWAFPSIWYSKSADETKRVWLGPQHQIAGWSSEEVPVDKSAEARLVADKLESYLYKRGDSEILAFSAKRYSERENAIGLFVHTPDRCWTESGWSLEPSTPELMHVDLHGVELTFERRIFSRSGFRELVYFGGLIGGHGCPYRLDHNLSVGMKYAIHKGADKTRTSTRAVDTLFWRRVWDSFATRSDLNGPKQFIRLSTSLNQNSIEQADRLLQEFLPLWLKPVDYNQELAGWQARKTEEQK